MMHRLTLRTLRLPLAHQKITRLNVLAFSPPARPRSVEITMMPTAFTITLRQERVAIVGICLGKCPITLRIFCA